MNDMHEEVSLEFLKSHGLFQGLDHEQLIRVLALAENTHFKKDELIFSEGEEGNSFYLILQGLVEVLKDVPTPEGSTRERIAMLERGETVGEMAIIDRMPRSASIRVISETWVISFDRHRLESMATEEPGIYQVILRNLAREISRKLRMIDSRFAISLFSDTR